MKKEDEHYFTVGEFANLFGVSKQTLLYYERNGIFLPVFTDTNGYRYYSVKQYFLFEILTTFRTLGIPLKKIAWYLNNRSPTHLRQILSDRKADFDHQIEILRANQRELEDKIAFLDLLDTLPTDKVLLENHQTESITITPFPEKPSPLKHTIQCIAAHNAPFFSGEIIKEHFTGYILTKEHMQKGEYKSLSYLFTPVTNPKEGIPISEKPSGIYATIYKKDSYHMKYTGALAVLQEFITRNNLEITGDAYIYPLRNYWSTDDISTYLTRVSVQVDY